jgi:hypothetical protein
LLLTGYSASINSQTVDPTTGLTISSTGNVLNLGGGLPWSGTVTGAAGGTSGGSTPAYNPSTGNIIFGYTTQTVSQSVAINTALANAGTGIQISGYKYSWQINNDLSNSGGNRGTLTGNVSLVGSSGSILESFNYDYSKENLPAFKTYSGTQFFNSRYDTTTASSLTVSFTGKDQNFWAGYYGPRVHVDDLSLLYTVKPTPVVVDPCISDPLSSPACPGYALATVKNAILGSTVSSASATSYVPTTNYTQPAPAAAPPAVADAAPALDQASPQKQAQQPAPQSSPPTQQQQQPGQDPNQNPGVAQDNPAQPSPQQQGPAPTQAQPAGGPPPTSTASAPPPSAGPQQSQAGPQQGSGGGPSKLAMSVVKSAQAKEQAMQQTAVQNAVKAFENTQQSSQAASNLAITMNQDMSANSATAAAQFSSQATQSSQQTAVQASQGPQQQQQASTQQQQTAKVVQQTQQQQEVQQQVQQSTSVVQVQQAQIASQQPQQETPSTAVAMLKPSQPAQADIQPQASSGTGLTVSRNPFAYNPLNSINVSNMGIQPAQTAPVYQPRIQERVMEVESQQVQVASFSGIGKAGNPLSEMMMQQRFEMMQENIQQQTSSVNRNVQPNDLAGGVDLASMALQPKGFEAYSFTLRDAAFYEPKEVYKGQAVVDNVRALRQMSSDSLHKQMIDMQYK